MREQCPQQFIPVMCSRSIRGEIHSRVVRLLAIRSPSNRTVTIEQRQCCMVEGKEEVQTTLINQATFIKHRVVIPAKRNRHKVHGSHTSKPALNDHSQTKKRHSETQTEKERQKKPRRHVRAADRAFPMLHLR